MRKLSPREGTRLPEASHLGAHVLQVNPVLPRGLPSPPLSGGPSWLRNLELLWEAPSSLVFQPRSAVLPLLTQSRFLPQVRMLPLLLRMPCVPVISTPGWEMLAGSVKSKKEEHSMALPSPCTWPNPFSSLSFSFPSCKAQTGRQSLESSDHD